MVWHQKMTNKRTLLLVDNNTQHRDVFRDAITNAIDGPFEGERVSTLAEGVERLKKSGIWAIFVNLSLPDSQGITTWLSREQSGFNWRFKTFSDEIIIKIFPNG